jgi:hypothetical protein
VLLITLFSDLFHFWRLLCSVLGVSHVQDLVIDIDLPDVQRATVSRVMLEKWYGEPFFLKSLPGVFIRVVAGGYGQHNKDYKIAEIIGVVVLQLIRF